MKRLLAPIPLAALIMAGCDRSQPTPSDLVFAQAGSVPILITAPHGGAAPVPGIEEQTSHAAAVGRDWRTDEIARSLMYRLEGLVGAKPYVVIAEFDRAYIDANRIEFQAFEDPKAEPYYLAYHTAIRSFVDKLRQEHPGALLIDIHGHAKDGFRDKICRGTRDGMTVRRMAGRGEQALTGPRSILGRLRAAGYEVYPENGPLADGEEGACYDGGYTVLTYGSHNCDGIDAIQLEIGRDLRENQAISRFTEALAAAVAVFHNDYQKGQWAQAAQRP